MRKTFALIAALALHGCEPAFAVPEFLTADRTYFVRVDGNDANSCLSDSAAGACATFQGAYNKAEKVNFDGYRVTLRAGGVGQRTFNDQIILELDRPWRGGGTLIIDGVDHTQVHLAGAGLGLDFGSASPFGDVIVRNVTVSGGTGPAINHRGFGSVGLQDVRLRGSTGELLDINGFPAKLEVLSGGSLIFACDVNIGTGIRADSGYFLVSGGIEFEDCSGTKPVFTQRWLDIKYGAGAYLGNIWVGTCVAAVTASVRSGTLWLDDTEIPCTGPTTYDQYGWIGYKGQARPPALTFLENFGITGVNQGTIERHTFGVGGFSAPKQTAAETATLATEDWSVPANRSAKFRINTRTNDALTVELDVGRGLHMRPSTALTAGGSLDMCLKAGSSPVGVCFGSGVPTIAAAKGTLYLRSDGSASNNRAYVATDSSGTWAPLTTGF